MFDKIKHFFNMLKFEHTIFALPFAYVGMILGSMAEYGTYPAFRTVLWVTLAMIGARSAAMALNRVIDKSIDALNPRTSNREIVVGKVSIKEAVIFICGSFLLLFYAAYQLNTLAIYLLPVAVFVLVIYSYTKRFTWLCHIVLGCATGLAPMGGWVGATGSLPLHAWLLFFTVALWTAGFDIIYACQDIKYDRQQNLHSIPVRFGVVNALWISRIFHVISAVLLFSWFSIFNLGFVYLVGTVLASVILFYEHTLVKPNDFSKLHTAFFTMNGILSMVIFIFIFVDRLS